MFLDEDSTELNLNNNTLKKEIFRNLKNYTDIEMVSLEHLQLVGEDSTPLSETEYNELINEVFSSWHRLKCIDACYTSLCTLDFIKNGDVINTPNLRILHILNTNVIDLSNLEELDDFSGLALNSKNVRLSLLNNKLKAEI